MNRSEYIFSLLTDKNLSFSDFLNELLLVESTDDGSDKDAKYCEAWNSIFIKLLTTLDIEKAAAAAVLVVALRKYAKNGFEDFAPDLYNITAGAYKKGLEDGKGKYDEYISGLMDYYDSDDTLTKNQKDLLYNVLSEAYTLGANNTSRILIITYAFTEGFDKDQVKELNEQLDTAFNENQE